MRRGPIATMLVLTLSAWWLFCAPRVALCATQQPHPAVARIIVPERDGTSYGSGTLVEVNDRQGLVVTNWHVVRDHRGEPITVVFPDGFRSHAAVLKADPTWDLAALSIWKPNAAPVEISAAPPRPGDVMAIAGYGSGDYRLAVGRCTKYLSPGDKQPAELVEVSAAARQGDSGGPMLNERGELAGVLFGEGGGYTAGSYGGRVRQFLGSVRGASSDSLARLERTGSATAGLADGWMPDERSTSTPANTVALNRVPANSAAVHEAGDPMAARFPPNQSAANQPTAHQFAGQGAGHNAGGWAWPSQAALAVSAGAPNANAASAWPTASTTPPYNAAQSLPGAAPSVSATPIGALSPSSSGASNGDGNLLGATRFEQAKSLLAVIGIVSIVVTFARAFSRE